MAKLKTNSGLLEDITILSKQNPNNMDLGAKVRSLVNKLNSNLNPINQPQPDNQITIFDVIKEEEEKKNSK